MRASAHQLAVEWKLHLAAAPAEIFQFLSTDRGRERFWAERSASNDGAFTLTFSGGEELRCAIVACEAPHHFAFRYFEETLAEFTLEEDERGGTDLCLSEVGFKDAAHANENRAGWIQVLLCLKAAADHGIDLRNHDPARTWAQGYCEN